MKTNLLKNLGLTVAIASVLCVSCETDNDGPAGGYSESDEYAFYVTFGTMPTLYAGLYLLGNEMPSYVFFERTQTFDTSHYPDYAEICPYMGGDNETQEKMKEWMMNTIRTIDQKNPDARFHLYVDDLRSPLSYDWFVAQGIDLSRLKVHLLSDGTGTYNEFYSAFAASGTGRENWEKYVAEINSLAWNSDGSDLLGTRALPEFEQHWHWSYPLSTLDNYDLTLHYDNMFETADPYVQEQLPKMHLTPDNVIDMLKRLPQAKQEIMYRMIPYDRQVFIDLMDASPKPNLIINGTSNQPENQRLYVGEVYEKYKEDYDIFFEPHPSDESYLDYEEAFPGLKNIPKTSFEFVLMFISDKIDAIGGFPSSIYLTVPVEKVKFMFAAGPEAMQKPLDRIFAAQEGIAYMLASE